MGSVVAAAIFSQIADWSGAIAALITLAIFIGGLLIITNIGGQGIHKFVRQTILSAVLCALFCFGANRFATKMASDFQKAAAATETGAPPSGMILPSLYFVSW